MSGRASLRNRRRAGSFERLGFGVVFRPVSAMRSGQVLACSLSLLAAGVLLTHGFIGLFPGRPVFVVLGGGLAASAVIGLAVDHVSVLASRQRPEHVLIDEVGRSRRFGHSLTLVAVRCSTGTDHRLVGRMRSTDRAWRLRNELFIMLAETDEVGAARFGNRIGDLVPSGDVRMATFPSDALTVDGLFDALHPVDPRPLLMIDGGEPGRVGDGHGRHSAVRAVREG